MEVLRVLLNELRIMSIILLIVFGSIMALGTFVTFMDWVYHKSEILAVIVTFVVIAFIVATLSYFAIK